MPKKTSFKKSVKTVCQKNHPPTKWAIPWGLASARPPRGQEDGQQLLQARHVRGLEDGGDSLHQAGRHNLPLVTLLCRRSGAPRDPLVSGTRQLTQKSHNGGEAEVQQASDVHCQWSSETKCPILRRQRRGMPQLFFSLTLYAPCLTSLSFAKNISKPNIITEYHP